MMGLKRLLLLTIVALPLSIVRAGSNESALVINEIMPANIDVCMDPSYNYGSWIELYNTSAQDIDITGWYLSNDAADKKQCPLGNRSRIVTANGFLTLWFGHLDDYCLNQIDFSMSYDGGQVFLFDPSGNEICSVEYQTIPARISYARTTDGGDSWSMTGYPTPGATNTTSKFASAQLSAPKVSIDSRIYTGQLSFNVDVPQGATLYYTLNGSTPVPGSQNTMTGKSSFNVTGTEVYRFRLYKDGMLPSPVTTRSFIKTSNNYGVPVVSIVTANDGLYNTNYGMWAKGPNGKAGNGQDDLCNWNRDWDRSVNIEIFDTNGNVILSQEAEITPSGRYSRAYTPHPFKIKAKKNFGYDNYFPFTPFSDKPYNKYQSLKFRSGGNNYQARLKDAALQTIILRSGLNVDCQSYQPVHHYINGVYQGIINIREPNNKDYAYSNYGFDEDEVDCFKLDHNNGGGGFTLTEGSRDGWDEWVQLARTASHEQAYKRICEIVDIEEFANYMAIEFFLANQDWPRNNIKAFRHKDDGRFRFVVFDLDHSFGAVNQATDINPFTEFDSQEYYPEGGYKSAMVTVFHDMLQNDTFRKLFIDSYSIVANSVFYSDRVEPIVNELASRAAVEMQFNGESPAADADLILNTLGSSSNWNYKNNRTDQLIKWSYSRLNASSKVYRSIKSNQSKGIITLNGLLIPNNRFFGDVFLPAQLKATAPVGLTFTGWVDGYGNLLSTDSVYDLSYNEMYVTATFTVDSEIERPVRINEISAANDVFINEDFKKHDWIELYNATSAKIDVSGMYLSDDIDKPLKFSLPQGTTIPARGYLVIWCDKESGTQLHAPFKLDNKDGSAVVLTASDKSWADTLIYNTHTGFQSVGLYPNGGRYSYIMNRPSLGKANNSNSYDRFDRTIITGINVLLNTPKNEIIYNLVGQPVTNPEPGQLYIKNGRKFFYKP